MNVLIIIAIVVLTSSVVATLVFFFIKAGLKSRIKNVTTPVAPPPVVPPVAPVAPPVTPVAPPVAPVAPPPVVTGPELTPTACYNNWTGRGCAACRPGLSCRRCSPFKQEGLGCVECPSFFPFRLSVVDTPRLGFVDMGAPTHGYDDDRVSVRKWERVVREKMNTGEYVTSTLRFGVRTEQVDALVDGVALMSTTLVATYTDTANQTWGATSDPFLSTGCPTMPLGLTNLANSFRSNGSARLFVMDNTADLSYAVFADSTTQVGQIQLACLDVDSMAYRLRPHVWFNTAEKYYPTSIENMLAVSYLVDGTTPLVMNPIPEDMGLYDLRFGPNRLTISIPEDAHGGINRYILNSLAPMYYHPYLTTQHLVLQYMFLYNFNGATRVAGFDNGAHDGDLEHVGVFVNLVTGLIDHVIMGVHGYSETWSGDELQFIEQRLKVYSAINSHASYPRAGEFCNENVALCVVKEKTDNTGAHWDPVQLVLVDRDTPWNQFMGNYGRGGPRAPFVQRWYENET